MLIIASTDLQKEIVEGERVSHMLRSKSDSWGFILKGAAFVSHFSRLAYGEILQPSVTELFVLFCW